ncbi:MAG: hypothetical protein IPQ07_39875 [Myxococcales bacterium]|nr:hypothetical protein [Myxococcales bacterium]
MTLDELDALHAAATAGEWQRAPASGRILADGWPVPMSDPANTAAIVALKNNWPAISARLRAAEAEVARLREQTEQRAVLRWFLDGDDHTHEDDCGARGQHDRDVCRSVMCVDFGCEGPHCTCDATEMRDRARAALGEP